MWLAGHRKLGACTWQLKSAPRLSPWSKTCEGPCVELDVDGVPGWLERLQKLQTATKAMPKEQSRQESIHEVNISTVGDDASGSIDH